MTRPSIPLALLLPAAVAGVTLALSRIGERPAAPLDLSLPWSVEEFHTKNAAHLAAEVADATDGRVRIVLHPGATLGIKGPESLRAARDGVVAMVDMAAFQQVGQEPLLGLDALPFLVRDQAELRLLYEDLRPAIEDALARHGLELLSVVPWPPQNLFTRRPIAELADLEGLVVRTLDANTTALARRLGMAPVQLAGPDVVPALASGALDAVMTSTTTAAAQKYWEFLEYIHRTNHGWVINHLVVGRDALSTLSPADRATLRRIARTLEANFWAVSRRDDAEKLARLEAGGVEIVAIPGELRATMQSAARPMWRDFAARVPGAAAILDRFLTRTGREPLNMVEDEAAETNS